MSVTCGSSKLYLSLLCISLPNYTFSVTSFRLGRGDGGIYVAYLVCADHCNTYGFYFRIGWADLKFCLHGFH